MPKQEEELGEIRQGLKEISEGKVVPLNVLEKRQELREGMYRIIIARDYSPLEQFDWERDLVGKLVEYLHDNDVVMKVDRELPDCDFCHGMGIATLQATSGYMQTYESSCLKCDGTGKDYSSLVAVEPLVKEQMAKI